MPELRWPSAGRCYVLDADLADSLMFMKGVGMQGQLIIRHRLQPCGYGENSCLHPKKTGFFA